jgi:hypothetical protein
MACVETRPTKKGTVRKYKCTCGHKEATIETMLIMQGSGKPLDSAARRELERVAGVLERVAKLVRDVKV